MSVKQFRRRDFLKASVSWLTLPTGVSVAMSREEATGHTVDRYVYQLRFVIRIENPSVSETRNQKLWLYMPHPQTANQALEQLIVSEPHRVLSDAIGHCVLEMEVPTLQPLGSRIVNVSATVALQSEPRAGHEKDLEPWLNAERYIESDNKEIAEISAGLLRQGGKNTSKAILDWVQQHIHYAGYIEEDLGASYALRHRRGDCTEYAYLVVALARACGIPARMVGGYVTDRSFVPHARDYHNWAELYFDGAWRLLDAQKGNWLVPAERYVAFRYHTEAILNPVGRAHRFSSTNEIVVRM